MSTTASSVNPSSVNNDNNNNDKYVISHPVTDANPSKTAVEAGAARNAYQHGLVQVSKGKVGGGDNKKNKNKKSKKNNRKSAMKKKFSKKFRRSILRKKSRKMGLHARNKRGSLHGGSNADNGNGGDKLTIPSFRQASPTGSSIINKLAGNHAQTLAYSAYDGQVSKPASS
jgi:hypothetical protein